LQPDSLIPDPANPQAWNRFSYGLNNPLRYTDPSGHIACDGAGKGSACDQANPDDLLKFYGITTSNITERHKWDIADATILADAKFSSAGYGSFRSIHGDFTVTGVGVTQNYCETTDSNITCGSAAQYKTAFLHEFGHIVDIRSGFKASDLDAYYDTEGNPIDGGDSWIRTSDGFKCVDSWTCMEHRPGLGYWNGEKYIYDQTSWYAKVEQWADLYMNWVLNATGDSNHGFSNDAAGAARNNYMTQQFNWLFTNGYLP
jgi:hypothetical protein